MLHQSGIVHPSLHLLLTLLPTIPRLVQFGCDEKRYFPRKLTKPAPVEFNAHQTAKPLAEGENRFTTFPIPVIMAA